MIKEKITGVFRLMEKYQTDKGRKHGYATHYEHYFEPIKHTVKKVVEMGILRGASLFVWKDYFPNARIFGIDCDEKRIPDSRITTIKANQELVADLEKAMEVIGDGIDIIIDDAGHSMVGQQKALGYLFKFLKPGGFYVIEDLHTSYMKDYNPTGTKITTVGMLSALISTGQLNSDYVNHYDAIALTQRLDFCNVEFGHKSEIAFLRAKDLSSGKNVVK